MAFEARSGSCQCGKVAFAAEVNLDETITCNCSRCQRLGSVLTMAQPGSFRLRQGEEAMTEYRFNSGTIQHLFCATCGIEPFARGAGPEGPMVMVNVNCLDGVDPRALTSQHYDGAST